MRLTKKDHAEKLDRLFERWFNGNETISDISQSSGISYGILSHYIDKRLKQKQIAK